MLQLSSWQAAALFVPLPRTICDTSEFPGGPRVPGELVMRKVAEYEVRAEECRRLAAQMKDPEQKKQLEDLAQAWELLARARTKHLQNGWGEPPAK